MAYSATAIDLAETNIDAHRVTLAAELATLQALSQHNSQVKGQIETVATEVLAAMDDISAALVALQVQAAAATYA